MGSATVLARFSSPPAAREALQALSRSGIDGVQVSLVGEGAERAERALDHSTERTDRREMRWIGPRLFVGAAIGGVIGLALGLVAIPVFSAGVTTALVIGLAAVGSVIGGFVAGVRSLPLSRDIDLTFADWSEPAELEVRIPDASVQHVNDMLRVLGAERVIRL